MTDIKPMTHGSLFTGIGGFDLGFDQNQIKTLWQVEIDKNCNQVLEQHYPDVKRFMDVNDCGKHNLEPVDIITFGSPCQDLSIAGKRSGLGGKRSGLFYEAIRIVSELKPTIAVWENVPGAFSSNSGRDFHAVLNAFRECGSRQFAWRVLDAQYFGVPQRRRRIFLISDFGGKRAIEILFESESMSGDTPQGGKAGKGIAGAITGGAHPGGFNGQDVENLIPAIQHSGSPGTGRDDEASLVAFRYKAGSKSGMPTISPTPTLEASTPLAVAIGHSGGETLKINPVVNTINTQTGSETTAMFNGVWENKQQSGEVRIHGDKSPTMSRNWGTGGNRVPNVGVRRLTPTECERLQGFPDFWTACLSDSARYRCLGNAVAVPVAEWIGKRIVEKIRL